MKFSIKTSLVLIIDTLVIILGYLLALYIRVDFDFGELLTVHAFFASLPLIVIIYVIALLMTRMNRSVLRMASTNEAIMIVGLNMVVTGVLLILKTLGILPDFPGSIVLMGFFINTIFIGIVHFSMRILNIFMIKTGRERYGSRTLIYGAGRAGKLLIREINASDKYHENVVGFVDDNPSLTGFSIDRYPILGTGAQLEKLVKQYQIEEVIIAIPHVSNRKITEISNVILSSGISKIQRVSRNVLVSGNAKESMREVEISDLLNREEVSFDTDAIQSHLNDKVVLVTGAGGSIGSELVRQLVHHGTKKVVLFDINETGLYNIEQEMKMKQRRTGSKTVLDVNVGTIKDVPRLESLFEAHQPHYVFHAAAHKHVPLMEHAPGEAIKNNIFGTKNLIEVSKKYHVEKFVNISTDKAVNPTNVMGATKRFNEMMLQESTHQASSTRFVAVRFGNVLGSNGSVIPLFKKQLEQGGPLTVTDPEMVRYFMTIPEAVSLVLQAFVYAEGGEIFVLDMGNPVKIDDLAKNMIRLSGLKLDDDIQIKYVGLRPGEKLYEELLMEEEGLQMTDNNLIYVAEPNSYAPSFINESLSLLESITETGNSADIKNALATVVTTYQIDQDKK